VELGTLGGGTSQAVAINDSSQVVGGSDTKEGLWRAFIWRAGAGMEDLGTLGGNNSHPYGINDLGQVVGGSNTETWDWHAFLWTAQGGMVDLGTLGGSQSQAVAVNQAGHVIGSSKTANGETHAFFWTAESGMVDLGTLGGNYSEAISINNLGQVIGWSSNDLGETHAFLWTAEEGTVDLGTLGGNYSYPFALNHQGQIAGGARNMNKENHAILWTVALETPENQIRQLMDQVKNLMGSRKLNRMEGHVLQEALERAMEKLGQGKEKTACQALRVFAEQVKVDLKLGRISYETGQKLMEEVEQVSVCQNPSARVRISGPHWIDSPVFFRSGFAHRGEKIGEGASSCQHGEDHSPGKGR
jgi:probable HAF family extracellular repeat protein